MYIYDMLAHAFADFEANVVPICTVVRNNPEGRRDVTDQWYLQAAEETALWGLSGGNLYNTFRGLICKGERRRDDVDDVKSCRLVKGSRGSDVGETYPYVSMHSGPA